MNKEQFEKRYWKYFLILEEEFSEIEKTIPVDTINFNTYSIKYMKLLFSVCSEIDVLFKDYIEYNEWFSFHNHMGNMGKYKEIITQNLTDFSNQIVLLSNQISLTPFSNWNEGKPLDWWKVYNDLKHNRTLTDNYIKATQTSLINAFAALYQLEMYFFKSILDKENFQGKLRMPVPHSKIYIIENWSDNIEMIDNRYIFYVDNNGNLILEGK